MEICEIGAIYLVDNKAQINQNRCTECGACIEVCPNDAIYVEHTEIQQYPISDTQILQQSVISAIKSTAVTLGSTLLPLAISKLGSLLSSKLENRSRSTSSVAQNFTSSGKRVRRRFRGKGGR